MFDLVCRANDVAASMQLCARSPLLYVNACVFLAEKNVKPQVLPVEPQAILVFSRFSVVLAGVGNCPILGILDTTL